MMKNKIKLTAFLGALLIGQAAWSVPVTYRIDLGALPSNSANWLYRVNDACNASSDLDLNHNNTADTLHFCGSQYYVLNGSISGDWDGQKLTNLSGILRDGTILGGSLGGAFYSATMQPLWTIVTDLFGTFVFEDLVPAVNVIDARYLTLWGQNLVAYGLRETCARAAGPGATACKGKALDIFAAVAVPEPTTIALLAFGLGGIAWTLRRRAAATRK
jgi:hypothetical protein